MTDNLTPEDLQERRAELVGQRDDFIELANREIAAFNGAISELGQLLKMMGVDVPENDTDPEAKKLGQAADTEEE